MCDGRCGELLPHGKVSSIGLLKGGFAFEGWGT